MEGIREEEGWSEGRQVNRPAYVRNCMREFKSLSTAREEEHGMDKSRPGTGLMKDNS